MAVAFDNPVAGAPQTRQAKQRTGYDLLVFIQVLTPLGADDGTAVPETDGVTAPSGGCVISAGVATDLEGLAALRVDDQVVPSSPP